MTSSNDKYLIDGQKLAYHPERVAQWLAAGDDWEKAKKVYPIYVEISPVGACNHRCTFCAVDYIGYKAVSLDTDILIERLREMAKLGVKSIMYAGEGEPLLHKHIGKLTTEAYYAGLDVAFTTNGTLLHRLETAMHHCKWVKVSVNAGTQATYRAIHKANSRDWDVLWANLKAAKKWKGDCTLGVQMVVLPENEAEIPALQALCDDAEVDYLVLKPYSQHKSSINKLGWKPVSLPTGKRTVIREEALKTESHSYEKCHATPNFWAYLMASGDVYSCSAYLLDERFLLGNIGRETFSEVWEGARRASNWRFVKQSLDIKECRVNCRMDKSNRYLAGFANQQHVNFV